MRFPVWIPKTGYGLVASLVAGAVIAAILFVVVFGSPSFDAPRGTEEYNRQAQALVISAIGAVAGGTWIGTRLERRRLLRRAELAKGLLSGYLERRVAEQDAVMDAVRGQPWADEALERGAAARAKSQTVRLRTVFDGLNPYFCLSFGSLVAYGFASAAELADVRRLIGSQEFPFRWANPDILRDLELLDSREDSLIRIGLWQRHREVDEPPAGV